jgi:hypothetical protein
LLFEKNALNVLSKKGVLSHVTEQKKKTSEKKMYLNSYQLLEIAMQIYDLGFCILALSVCGIIFSFTLS